MCHCYIPPPGLAQEPALCNIHPLFGPLFFLHQKGSLGKDTGARGDNWGRLAAKNLMADAFGCIVLALAEGHLSHTSRSQLTPHFLNEEA